MIKTQKYKVPLYGNTFNLVVYNDDLELRELIPNYDFEDNDPKDFNGCVFYHEDELYITFNSFVRDGVQYPTAGIVAHESKHLTNNIFIAIGQKLDAWNDEAECYLLMWVVDQIHEFFGNTPNPTIQFNKSDFAPNRETI